MAPGEMLLMRIIRPASSCAMVCISIITPPLDAA
jgi:hypothetical protein